MIPPINSKHTKKVQFTRASLSPQRPLGSPLGARRRARSEGQIGNNMHHTTTTPPENTSLFRSFLESLLRPTNRNPSTARQDQLSLQNNSGDDTNEDETECFWTPNGRIEIHFDDTPPAASTQGLIETNFGNTFPAASTAKTLEELVLEEARVRSISQQTAEEILVAIKAETEAKMKAITAAEEEARRQEMMRIQQSQSDSSTPLNLGSFSRMPSDF